MWARRLFAACGRSKRHIRPTRSYRGSCSAFRLLIPRFVHNSRPGFGTKRFLEEAVPASTLEEPQSGGWNKLLPREREAFARLAEADLVPDSEGSQFLTLPEPLRWMWEYRDDLVAAIYKRDCYDGLLAFITSHLDKGRGVVITGTPGIGKTGFLWYLLWWSLKDSRDAVLAIAGRYYVLQWKDKQLEVKLTRNVDLVAETFDDTRPLFLADKVVPDESRIFPFKFILTCSPRESSAGELKKGGGIRELYLPTWTEEELCKLSRRVFGRQDEAVRKRFFMWGGIPRFVIEPEDPDPELLQKAISVTVQQDVRKLRFNENLIAIPEHLSHKVFHCKPVEGDFTRVRHFPASSYVVEQLLKELPYSALESFLHEPVHEQLLDLQSAMWEKYVLSYLELGGELQARTLAGVKSPAAKGSRIVRPESVAVVGSEGKLSKYDKQAVGDPIPDRGKDATFVILLPDAFSDDLPYTLITSTSRNNSVWNAIKGNTMFQITASKTRETVRADSFQMRETFRFMDMVCGAGCEKELVYVVPRCVFPIFTVKNTGNLKVKVATIPAKVPSLSQLFQEFLSKVISRHRV